MSPHHHTTSLRTTTILGPALHGTTYRRFSFHILTFYMLRKSPCFGPNLSCLIFVILILHNTQTYSHVYYGFPTYITANQCYCVSYCNIDHMLNNGEHFTSTCIMHHYCVILVLIIIGRYVRLTFSMCICTFVECMPTTPHHNPTWDSVS